MLYRTSDAPDALRAYLYGFICHFALDSTCHPYIEKMEHDSGLSHAEIETELERHFMLIDRKDPASYVPIEHIQATEEASRVIAPCFGSLAPEDIKASLKGMIRSHNLLHAPKKAKRDVLYLGLRLAGKYDSMQGLVMKPDANEASGQAVQGGCHSGLFPYPAVRGRPKRRQRALSSVLAHIRRRRELERAADIAIYNNRYK